MPRRAGESERGKRGAAGQLGRSPKLGPRPGRAPRAPAGRGGTAAPCGAGVARGGPAVRGLGLPPVLRSPAAPVSGARAASARRPLPIPVSFQARRRCLSEAASPRGTAAVPRGTQISARTVNQAPQSRRLPFIFYLLISAVGTVQQAVMHFSLAVDLFNYLEYKPR